MAEKIFEKATKMKLRFDTPLGSLPVEDVWDLPLLPAPGRKNQANLNDLAKALNKAIKDHEGEDFVRQRLITRTDELLQLRFDVVKRIIDVKLEELDAAEAAAKAQEKKARIMEIIARKEDESLAEKSIDDLRNLLEEL